MSDYTKVTDFSTKDSNQDLIEGADFDTEFGLIQSMSQTKPNKVIPATASNIAGLASDGDLEDSGVTAATLATAIASINPVGTLAHYAGSSAPTGWLLCDGSSVSTATYAGLFAVIGYTFGGSGSSFSVPDARGRALVALDNLGGSSANRVTDSNADSLGGVYGAATHTLTDAEMPSHNHGGSTSSNGAHTHSYSDARQVYTPGGPVEGGNNFEIGDVSRTTGSSGAHTHTISSAGSDSAHNNVQPSLFVGVIIKT